MFAPPFCPNQSCSAHSSPAPGFFKRDGFYRAKCRSHRVQRYCCKRCNKTFSRQTFRADRWDKRPHLNVLLVQSVSSGLGLRATSRMLGLSLRSTDLKFRKLAKHLRQLDVNVPLRVPKYGRLQRAAPLEREWAGGVRPPVCSDLEQIRKALLDLSGVRFESSACANARGATAAG